jgi:hypothetical protein
MAVVDVAQRPAAHRHKPVRLVPAKARLDRPAALAGQPAGRVVAVERCLDTWSSINGGALPWSKESSRGTSVNVDASQIS